MSLGSGSGSSSATWETDYIDVTEFTRNVVKNNGDHTVSGDGIIDVLMMTATKHLQAQFEGNRIRKEDYATAYIQIYQATLQAAMQAWLQKGIADKQLALLEKQGELLEKQMVAEMAKKDLYRRQIEGFDEDYKQKILKICLDSWAVGFSVAKDSFKAEGIPAPMGKPAIDDIFNKYIFPDFDNYVYRRTKSVLNGDEDTENTEDTDNTEDTENNEGTSGTSL